MVELILKNVLIGSCIIIINLVPILMKKYKLIPITIIISIILMILGIYF